MIATTEFEVTREDISTVMTLALDEGITGWCSVVHIEDRGIGDGDTLPADIVGMQGVLALKANEAGAPHALDLPAFLRGLGKAVATGYIRLGPGWARTVDARAADAVVQFALFGTVRYDEKVV